jgi:outer membrane protein OmpA-like peptidoglycan-associated protein
MKRHFVLLGLIFTLCLLAACGSTSDISVPAKLLAPSVTFSASTNTIKRGGSTVLTWNTTNADSVVLLPFGTVPPNGSQTVSPDSTTLYVLKAVSKGAEVSQAALITVTAKAPLTVTLIATPATIKRDQSSTLSWTTTNATSITIEPNIGTVVTPTGSVTLTPNQTTTYTIAVGNADGNASASASVTVVQPTTFRVYFETKKSVLTATKKSLADNPNMNANIKLLDSLALTLKKKEHLKTKLQLIGNADDAGKDNEKLSRQRAEAVQAYLVRKGIKKNRVAVSWAANTNPRSKSLELNRRTDIVLVED